MVPPVAGFLEDFHTAIGGFQEKCTKVKIKIGRPRLHFWLLVGQKRTGEHLTYFKQLFKTVI
jgi:hypothetical protein